MRFPIANWLTLLLLAPSAPAAAAERTVMLAVENMTCVACPYIVEKTLVAIPGVKQAKVSFERRTAIVTYDDTQTDVSVLTAATTNAGYPSHQASGS